MKIIFNTETFGDIEVDSTIKPQLNEALSTEDMSQIKTLFNKMFKESSSEIEAKVKNIVKKEIGSKATEEVIVDIARNCIIQLYKTLWVRRAAWTNGIKNQRA